MRKVHQEISCPHQKRMKTFLIVLHVIFCSTLKVVQAFQQSANGFVAIGDWGSGTESQRQTAKSLSTWCLTRSCGFIVSTGDNFYPSGVISVTDPKFETTWRSVYDLPGIKNTTWVISLGNHDYGNFDGREKYQLEFGEMEPRWYFPHKWYDALIKLGNTTVHLLVIDTIVQIQTLKSRDKQLEWLEQTLKTSNATWKIVIGHHPPFTAGKHSPGSKPVRRDIVPILEKYNVDVLLQGHDHNLQHINITKPQPGKNIDYVISGGGGKELYSIDKSSVDKLNKLGYSLRYFAKDHGFVAVEVSPKKLSVVYVNSNSTKPVYEFSRWK